jgi:hypothetical protein
MDFAQLATAQAHAQGAECNIKNPLNGEPTDVFITIMGADSREWRAAKKAQTSQILKAKSQGKEESLDFDKMDVDALVSVTLGWRGIAKDGEDYEFNKKNARELYQDAPGVVTQLLEFLGDGENFISG